MSPEELEDLKRTDPERYWALRQPEDDALLRAQRRWQANGWRPDASEYDSALPSPHEHRARADQEASREVGDPAPPGYGTSGTW